MIGMRSARVIDQKLSRNSLFCIRYSSTALWLRIWSEQGVILVMKWYLQPWLAADLRRTSPSSSSWIFKFPVTVLRVLLCISEVFSQTTKAMDKNQDVYDVFQGGKEGFKCTRRQGADVLRSPASQMWLDQFSLLVKYLASWNSGYYSTCFYQILRFRGRFTSAN